MALEDTWQFGLEEIEEKKVGDVVFPGPAVGEKVAQWQVGHAHSDEEAQRDTGEICRHDTSYALLKIVLECSAPQYAVEHEKACDDEESLDACTSCDEPKLRGLGQCAEVHQYQREGEEVAQEVKAVTGLDGIGRLL